MLGLQRDLNLGVVRADRPRIAVGEIDARIRQADVIEDRMDLARRDLLPQGPFDLVAEPRRLFHPQAGPCAHMQTEQAGIDRGKEILAQNREQPQERTQKARKQRAKAFRCSSAAASSCR